MRIDNLEDVWAALREIKQQIEILNRATPQNSMTISGTTTVAQGGVISAGSYSMSPSGLLIPWNGQSTNVPVALGGVNARMNPGGDVNNWIVAVSNAANAARGEAAAAQSTANSALSAANAAQSTANSALSTANSAWSRAGTGISDAAAALAHSVETRRQLHAYIGSQGPNPGA